MLVIFRSLLQGCHAAAAAVQVQQLVNLPMAADPREAVADLEAALAMVRLFAAELFIVSAVIVKGSSLLVLAESLLKIFATGI